MIHYILKDLDKKYFVHYFLYLIYRLILVLIVLKYNNYLLSRDKT